MNRRSYLLAVIVAAVSFATLVSFSPSARAQQLDAKSLSALKWRLIGPYRGGRVEAVEGLPGTNTYFFGSVDGGVWKSEDAGQNWEPLFDKEPVQS
ncbi:MAG: hypothetical protein WA153_11285, partial [Candidatus Acidiferrales bacterium]